MPVRSKLDRSTGGFSAEAGRGLNCSRSRERPREPLDVRPAGRPAGVPSDRAAEVRFTVDRLPDGESVAGVLFFGGIAMRSI